MKIPPLSGREQDLLTFMKENGYPVFHRSNIFLRDVQYGVRDYYRDRHGIDIGSRESDYIAGAVIKALEADGRLNRISEMVWILNMEEFLNPVKDPEKKEAAKTAETSAA